MFPQLDVLFDISNDTQKKYVVEFFGLKLPLFLGEIKGEFTETYSKNQIKFLNHNIPITVYKKKYDFYEVYDAKFTKSDGIAKPCRVLFFGVVSTHSMKRR